jgi:hypothetical protein
MPASAIVIIESVQAVITFGAGVSGISECLAAFVAFSFTERRSK